MRLSLEGVSFSYASDSVLNDISFNVEKHDVVAILGPNGVGKTTLLRCIDRILYPTGSVLIDNENIDSMYGNEIAERIGYVMQRGEPTRTTVFESVLLGRKPHIVREVKEKDLKIVGRAIDIVGLSHISGKYTDEISGGEYQLVRIARALAQQPKLLLFDEPTSNLDPSNQHSMMRTIRNIVKNNDMSLIFVAHDLNLSLRYADSFILLKEGKIHSAGGIEVITEENIRSLYGIDVYIEHIHGIPVIVPK